MSASTSIFSLEIKKEQLRLLPEKAIHWPKKNTIMVADCHLGKSGHFQKHGIAVPSSVMDADLQRLEKMIVDHTPERLLILGDLFHSDHNKEFDAFAQWRENFPALKLQLVQGNHDIIPAEKYISLGIELLPKIYQEEEFLFVHEPAKIPAEHAGFAFTGHIHPGIRLSGKGRQSLRLPCFYFNHTYAILPAFGKFTGLANIKHTNGDRIFAVAGEKVMEV